MWKYFILFVFSAVFSFATTLNGSKKVVYIVSDIRIPFWEIMSRGVKDTSLELGYNIEIVSPNNNPKKELELVAKALKEKVAGIVISPTTSSACATILKIAKKANIPVVISDIGTDRGEYVSFISSNNKEGAYQLGKILAKKMRSLHYENGDVGIIAIPQKRLNGQLRTEGFLKALNEANIKSIDLKQQVTFSYQETYDFAKDMIKKHSNLKAIWLQGSDRYQGALDAISDMNKKGKILLIVFDAEPEFIDLIPQGVLVGAGMQQPYLMGKEALLSLDKFLHKKKVDRNLQLEILAVSQENIQELLPVIKQNVLGISSK